MTFGDIYNKFKHKFPNLDVDDWRPYGMNTITVWLRDSDRTQNVDILGHTVKEYIDVIEVAFEYDSERDIFIFKGRSSYRDFIDSEDK